MLTVWLPVAKGLAASPASAETLAGAVWIDAVDITPDEERQLEKAYGIEVPTREEMSQLEVSHRLYRESDALYLSSSMLVKTDTDLPQTAAVTFILSPQRLVTVRYADVWSFRTTASRCVSSPDYRTAEDAFVGLLDATVERLGDMLERLGGDLEARSVALFSERSARRLDLDTELRAVGRIGNALGKIRESLIDKIRLLNYAMQIGRDFLATATVARLHTLVLDSQSLADQASFTAGRVQSALDAALGLITVEQNRVIKIFSIAAVIFLPPTLVGTVYGMNFTAMPEIDWPWGYPFALALMVLSVLVTLWFFRRKRWL